MLPYCHKLSYFYKNILNQLENNPSYRLTWFMSNDISEDLKKIIWRENFFIKKFCYVFYEISNSNSDFIRIVGKQSVWFLENSVLEFETFVFRVVSSDTIRPGEYKFGYKNSTIILGLKLFFQISTFEKFSYSLLLSTIRDEMFRFLLLC